MIPVHLDPRLVRIGLVGNGVLTRRRLGWLRAGGGDPLVYADNPEAELAAEAGERLCPRLPRAEEWTGLHIAWIADLPDDLSLALATAARAARVLVNVEDVNPLCDFHTPAVTRRGALTLSAGTGGASPAAARAAKARLEAAFPTAWAQALDEIAAARASLKAQGAAPAAIIADAQRRLSAHGLWADDQ